MSIVTPPKEEWPYIEVYGGDFRGCLKDMADTVTRFEFGIGLKMNLHQKVRDMHGGIIQILIILAMVYLTIITVVLHLLTV